MLKTTKVSQRTHCDSKPKNAERSDKMFDVNILSTGSKGNCVVIDDTIMLDAGIPKGRIIKNESYDLSKLEVLLVSHKHKDHANLPMIRWAITENIRVHLPHEVVKMIVDEGRLDIRPYMDVNVFVHEDQDTYPLTSELTVKMHPQKHHNIINYAFVLEKTVDDMLYRLLYSTDLDTIHPTDIGPGLVDLGMFDTIMLEGNYDELWLRDYINVAISSVDNDMDTGILTDAELDKWVRDHYNQLPKSVAAGLFRAVQNMRHLSKQQARMYARAHLNKGGAYYEMHPSSMFYERPDDWDTIIQ